MLTDEQLAEIEQRIGALEKHATAGDWFYDRTDAVQVLTQEDTELVATVWGEAGSDEERALGEFIAHARQDVPALLAEVKRQQHALNGAADHVARLIDERDRAREIAVALEQQLAEIKRLAYLGGQSGEIVRGWILGVFERDHRALNGGEVL